VTIFTVPPAGEEGGADEFPLVWLVQPYAGKGGRFPLTSDNPKGCFTARLKLVGWVKTLHFRIPFEVGRAKLKRRTTYVASGLTYGFFLTIAAWAQSSATPTTELIAIKKPENNEILC
jgi:hypothetical protein